MKSVCETLTFYADNVTTNCFKSMSRLISVKVKEKDCTNVYTNVYINV